MNDTEDTLLALTAQSSGPLTMSSREIAELCEARHNDVVATIERLFESEVLRESRKTSRLYSPPGGGRPTQIFDLTKRDTLVVVSGYNDQVRARIIDRWMELEANLPRPTLPDLSDPVVLTSLLVEHASQRIEAERRAQAAEAKAQAMLPKVEAHDRLDASVGSICLTDAAKTLKMGPQKLIQFLSTRGWIYKRVGNSSWLGRQEKIAAGYLEHKEHVYKDSLLQERVSTRVLVTGRGLLKLAELLAQPLQ